VVPYVRGREVSRPSSEILAEIRALAASGVREVTLIGQNVNSYGRKEQGEMGFAELIGEVHRIEEVARIRFTTSHPKDLSPELIDCFGTFPKLCGHIHLPVQSGSDRVLNLMNRGYTRRQYLEKVERLRKVRSDIRLTSDIIVGFPGETEEDFEQTLSLMAEVGYADLYSFLYSPRPGTAAAELKENSAPKEKQDRFDRMLRQQEAVSRRTWEADVGRTLAVLVEGNSRQGEGQVFGRTTWNRIVNFQGEPALVGRIVPVRIVKSFKNSQLGVLCES
jgi:tRNA-2-methylthio-N6-dimethylallyladenosine synthase